MKDIDQLCSVLNSLGLNSKEVKIYKHLLSRGITTPNVVSKLTKIERSTCYGYLDSLSKTGLISETRLNKKKAYFAESPEKVIDLLDKKKRNLNLQRKIAIDAVRKIKVKASANTFQPDVQYFTGLEGVKKMYLETLKTPEKILIFFGWDFYPEELRDFIDNEYIPARVKSGISCDVITNDSIIEHRDLKELRRRKKINRSFSPNVEINIYSDKVNFVTYRNGSYMGLLIKNIEIANSMKEVFSVMWNEETPQAS